MTVSIPETTGPTIIGASAPPAGTELTGTPSDNTSARAQLTAWFTAVGLPTLGTWAWDKFLRGDSFDQIMLDMRDTPEYKARFPAIDQLRQQGRGIDEASYISYENTIKDLHQRYGLPPGLYDTPDQIAQGLLNHVSPQEAEYRAQQAAYAAYQAPASVKAAFAGRLGVQNTLQGLTAAYLDDKRAIPLLEQQLAAAQVQGASVDAGAATTTGFADTLAGRGVSYGQALQGFEQVAGTQALGAGFGETAGQHTREQAAFGDTGAARSVTRVVKGRLAQFSPGGQPAEGQTGVSGLASSSS